MSVKPFCGFCLIFLCMYSCTKKATTTIAPAPLKSSSYRLITSTFDASMLLQDSTYRMAKASQNTSPATITLDPNLAYQTMDGFGFTLTGGSAMLIQKMDSIERKKLLTTLFDCISGSCISYLRISIGASDLDERPFTYNDINPNDKDNMLTFFDLSPDKSYLIPTLKQILQINPAIKIMASPWSAPAWMKTNRTSKGGSLKKECFFIYSRYLAKYLSSMRDEGITIDAMTIQNEPEHGGNNPSMLMTAEEQARFIKGYLGPSFLKEKLKTKIIVWDHNCDHPQYPMTIFKDKDAGQYIDGAAFHLYAGDISAMSTVHDSFPDYNLYFTEQWTSSEGKFSDDLAWHSKNLLIGAPRNWAKTVLEWNLANDPTFHPHTDGGCTQCKGAVTIDQSAFSFNVSYYLISHLSKFVRPKSQRISSTNSSNFPNVAFKSTDGKYILFVMNEAAHPSSINISVHATIFSVTLPASSINTIVW